MKFSQVNASISRESDNCYTVLFMGTNFHEVKLPEPEKVSFNKPLKKRNFYHDATIDGEFNGNRMTLTKIHFH